MADDLVGNTSDTLMLRAPRPGGSSDARGENRRLVISELLHLGRASRASISRATGLAPTTVSVVVEELVDGGFVREERGQSSGGKPPIELLWQNNAGHIVAVDVTRSTGALIDLGGNIVERRTWTDGPGRGRSARSAVTKWCEETLALAPGRVIGVGIAVPGLVDGVGTVVESLALDWHGERLGEHLQEKLGLPANVINDTQACAFGEYWTSAPHSRNAATVSIGAGVGAGLILGGQLIGGAGSAAGELGHLFLKENGIQCVCGNYGCVETVLTEPRLVERLIAASPTLGEVPSAAEIFRRAAEQQDAEAVAQVVAEIGDDLGAAVAPLVGTLGIESISFVGNIAYLGTPLLDAVDSGLRARCLPALARRVHLEFSELGELGSLVGAGGGVFHAVFGTF